MLQHCWLDGGLVVVMALGIIGVMVHRIWLGYGIGERSIQLVAVCLVIPTVLIVGLEDKASKEIMGTLLGAIVGYTLSGIGGRTERPASQKVVKKTANETKPLA